ncbi:MAG: transcriptional regulator [Methylobacter sp.]|nr:MAG: transcriptional regulator [Methylobacter sp.]
MAIQSHQLPETGFLRIWHIIGNPRANPPIPALIPIGRTTFLNGVKSGKFPQPVKTLGSRTTAWKVEDIRALINSMGSA